MIIKIICLQAFSRTHVFVFYSMARIFILRENKYPVMSGAQFISSQKYLMISWWLRALEAQIFWNREKESL